ncbi:MAG: energy transducer TonB, partial [Sphingomonas sp.]|nr:energy transducer TonB [Sphingomonas sp.]
MPAYRATPAPRDRATAIAAVIAVHAAMAAILLARTHPGVALTPDPPTVLVDIQPPPPPPPPTPPPEPKRDRPRDEEGAAGKKAEPTEIVAPPARLPAISPVAAAPIAGTGAAPT